MKTICDFITRQMGFIVLACAILSLAFPAFLSSIPTFAINPMLGLIMFGMGLTLDPVDFKIVLTRPRDIIVGCCAQFIIMPALAFALTKVFNLPPELAIGVVLVGCCPGGTASNVITFLARGDLALSVGMTIASTILAPFLTPLLVWLSVGTLVDVDALGMLLSILYVVIAPIAVGLLCQRFLPSLTHRTIPYLPAFSTLMITLVVGIIVAHNASKLLSAGLVVISVVILHNVCGLSLGYALGRLLRLSRPKNIAISIEVGMQNSGLASSLAVLHFSSFPLATIPGAVFSVWHNISGALIAKLYARSDKAPSRPE
ncbi:MAG: bile acid:sodium symporter family protein [Bacteroidales bacterium]|nr:bile acid:sodium symporter family protein [Bacteroidales bacterium]